MTPNEKTLRQRAEESANLLIGSPRENKYGFDWCLSYEDGFIAGHHSRDEEVRELSKHHSEMDGLLIAARAEAAALRGALKATIADWNRDIDRCDLSVATVVFARDVLASPSLGQALLDEVKALRKVAEAALYLRNSGYDGPFIGEVCVVLFDALAELDRVRKGAGG